MSDTMEQRLAKLEAEVEKLRDRDAIREILHRYCRAADRCDLDAFRACYWPDGRDDHGFFAGNAWEFADYVQPVLRQIESSVHAITNEVIDLRGDQAFCESQFSVVHRLRKPDGEGFLDYWHQGRYLDIFEKRDGEWRILVRLMVGDMDRLVRTKDMRAILDGFAGAPQGPAGPSTDRGARHPDDPVFRGFDLPELIRDRPGMADLWGIFHALGDVL